MTRYLVLVTIGYLFGAIPFGLLIGWLISRVDVRDHGSGSTGMTNVLRSVGRPAAVVVLILDMSKAVGAILLARMVSDDPGLEVATALAAIAGHIWPIFIGFRGGKGTASGWAALFVLSPFAGIIATVIGLSIVVFSRYVSLGSIFASALGSLTLIVLAWVGEVPFVYMWYGALGAPLIITRHSSNIQRLFSGTERKFGR